MFLKKCGIDFLCYFFAGVFMTNLVARSRQMKDVAIESLGKHFASLLSVSFPEDVNELVIGLPSTQLRTEIVGDCEGASRLQSDGKLSEQMMKKLELLSRHVEDCSGGGIKAESLQSRLVEVFANLSYSE